MRPATDLPAAELPVTEGDREPETVARPPDTKIQLHRYRNALEIVLPPQGCDLAAICNGIVAFPFMLLAFFVITPWLLQDIRRMMYFIVLYGKFFVPGILYTIASLFLLSRGA